jgi:hypothetical protein|tara:strand:+ start:28790 stop:29440 length:651 start_codon:yes stop_codon:yes gene_type:complete
MNSTKIVVTALLGFIINVASAQSYNAGLGYASDYFYRGALKSEEAVQASFGAETELGGLNVSAGAFANQAVGNGADSYQLTLGAGKSLNDLLSVYGGLNHFEDVAGEALFEAKIGLGFDTLLSPSVNVYRSFDDDLYTFEVSVNHQFELEVADLCVHASAGNTDLTEALDTDYYVIGAKVSRDLAENASVAISADRVDSDLIDSEWVFGLSVSTNF